MDNNAIESILNILPFKRAKLPVRYLEVPLMSKKISVKDCKSLIDKVKSRIHDWKNKSLSYAGRPQLLAYVLAFKLPKIVIKDIERPKENGGLGFKPMKQWNNVLLVKHLWNVANKKDTLWVKKDTIWFHQDLMASSSSTWEGVRKHMQYKIGNRCSVSMWHDNWTMLPTLDTVVSRREIYITGLSNEASLADCVENNKWKWPDQWFTDHPVLNQYSVLVLNVDVEDKLM
ncbi:hypothetical protein Tco_0435174 [Tanacetum coccineum]